MWDRWGICHPSIAPGSVLCMRGRYNFPLMPHLVLGGGGGGVEGEAYN